MTEPGRMRTIDAVMALDGLATDDPERAHSEADAILQSSVHVSVSDAYDRVAARCRWWVTA
jgi:hypothetical protein